MVKNLYREISMAEVEGYGDFTDWQKDIFDRLYKDHMFAMIQKDRVKALQYREEKLVNVQFRSIDYSYIVTFSNKESYIYHLNRESERIEND